MEQNQEPKKRFPTRFWTVLALLTAGSFSFIYGLSPLLFSRRGNPNLKYDGMIVCIDNGGTEIQFDSQGQIREKPSLTYAQIKSGGQVVVLSNPTSITPDRQAEPGWSEKVRDKLWTSSPTAFFSMSMPDRLEYCATPGLRFLPVLSNEAPALYGLLKQKRADAIQNHEIACQIGRVGTSIVPAAVCGIWFFRRQRNSI